MATAAGTAATAAPPRAHAPTSSSRMWIMIGLLVVGFALGAVTAPYVNLYSSFEQKDSVAGTVIAAAGTPAPPPAADTLPHHGEGVGNSLPHHGEGFGDTRSSPTSLSHPSTPTVPAAASVSHVNGKASAFGVTSGAAASAVEGANSASGVGATLPATMPSSDTASATSIASAEPPVSSATAPSTASATSQQNVLSSTGSSVSLSHHTWLEPTDSAGVWEPSLDVLPTAASGCSRILLNIVPHGGFGSAFMRSLSAVVQAHASNRVFVEHHGVGFPYDEDCPGGRKGFFCFFLNFSNCADPPVHAANVPVMKFTPGKSHHAGALALKQTGSVLRATHAYDFKGYKPALDALAMGILCKNATAQCLAALPPNAAQTHCAADVLCQDQAKPPYWDSRVSKHLGQLRTVAQAIWKPRPEVAAEVRRRLAPLKLRHPYAVVHMRKGDKYKETPRTKGAVYVKSLEREVRRLLGRDIRKNKRLPAGQQPLQVYLMGDQYVSGLVNIERMLKQRPTVSTVTLATAEDTGFIERKFRQQDKFEGKTKREMMLGMLTDFQAAFEADVFVGTQTSNVASVIQLMRTQPPDTATDVNNHKAVVVRECAVRYDKGCNSK